MRDLGGLVLELVRRDAFREDLVYEQCSELLGIDERIQELDALLASATSVRRKPPAARCSCGAPILWGSHFCANCGRPVTTETEGQAPDASAEDDAARPE